MRRPVPRLTARRLTARRLTARRLTARRLTAPALAVLALVATVLGLLGAAGAASAATPNRVPVGAATSLHAQGSILTLTGWAADLDRPAPDLVRVVVDGHQIAAVTASRYRPDVARRWPRYGSHRGFLARWESGPGRHTACADAIDYPSTASKRLGCRTVIVGSAAGRNPAVGLDTAAPHSPGAAVTGWAVDPDTAAPIPVRIVVDGRVRATVRAARTGGSHSGHGFAATVALPDGRHTLCAVAVNVGPGTGDTRSGCRTVVVRYEPYGRVERLTRAAGATRVVATGWAVDPNTSAPIRVRVSIDGHPPVTRTAALNRPDVARAHPGAGARHGFSIELAAGSGAHTVCIRAVNALGGTGTVALVGSDAAGCRRLAASGPQPSSAPRRVTAVAGFGTARVSWLAPALAGGARRTGYTLRALPTGPSVRLGAAATAVTLHGLHAATRYRFAVTASSALGSSPAGFSATLTTPAQPPAQTSPAPISTSRYIRNISGASAAELAMIRSEGAADARANPTGHKYLVLLCVGGQDERRQGVILSATVRFVPYAALVADLKAYVTGYASQQRPSAPVTIAISTNNDIDVSRTSGIHFADRVIDPLAGYAGRYAHVTIAGSDDMEPGFLAGYAATKAWLQGYLSATSARFVFGGSADGCSGARAGGPCNNGWTMSGLAYLAGGAAPRRITDVPQIYNTTMARQWRYISLTGVVQGSPRLGFGGALTEWTACHQGGGCGSLTGTTAWTVLWTQLNADARLHPGSLPYSTDLRIDR